MVGSRGDRPTVASPVHKQVFDLGTGQYLDDPASDSRCTWCGWWTVSLEAHAMSA